MLATKKRTLGAAVRKYQGEVDVIVLKYAITKEESNYVPAATKVDLRAPSDLLKLLAENGKTFTKKQLSDLYKLSEKIAQIYNEFDILSNSLLNRIKEAKTMEEVETIESEIPKLQAQISSATAARAQFEEMRAEWKKIEKKPFVKFDEFAVSNSGRKKRQYSSGRLKQTPAEGASGIFKFVGKVIPNEEEEEEMEEKEEEQQETKNSGPVDTLGAVIEITIQAFCRQVYPSIKQQKETISPVLQPKRLAAFIVSVVNNLGDFQVSDTEYEAIEDVFSNWISDKRLTEHQQRTQLTSAIGKYIKKNEDFVNGVYNSCAFESISMVSKMGNETERNAYAKQYSLRSGDKKSKGAKK